MSSDGEGVTRRYVLQTLGATGAGAIAGCLGGDSDDSEDTEKDTETDTTPEDTSTPEPDYSLPESEHVNPVDMATEWMIFPDDQGDYLQAVALSPSKLSEHYNTTLAEDIGADDKYGVFEFSHTDIPETFLQHAVDPWDSRFKVDQLPNNISEEDVAQQLEEAGYSMQHQRGEFEVYRGEEDLRAVGEDRHIAVLGSLNASISQQRELMFRVLEETNENRYKIPEATQMCFDELNVQDSLTAIKRPGYALTPSTGTSSYQPQIGMSSVNFEEGEKNGAWTFENAQKAENALTILENSEVRDGYSDLRLDDRTVTAEEGNYNIGELGTNSWLRVSEPRI